ncbi:MAG: serine hydrolase [Saprospiraceae bacterium]|nr:serine hydrolase [Saprospiraceae bacterium]
MKHNLFLIPLFCLLCITMLRGQQPDKNQSGIRSNDSLELDKKIDSIFSSYNNNVSPGAAVSIIQNGKVLAKKDYGMASIELQVPFSHQSVVRIGYSEAREFISIAAVLMENDGILNLNDKVRKYFPNLPEWSESVTIWDLLNHRSGFVDEWSTLLLMHASMSNRLDKEQFFRLLYTQPKPEIEPGKGYMYSNSDFGLLRLIMEKASGRNLPEWMKKRIFDPLKMINTRMQNNAWDIVPNRANKYSHLPNGFRLDNVQKTSPGGNYFILTCADDIAKWSIALSEPGSELDMALQKLLKYVRTIPGKMNHYVTGHSIDTINNYRVIFHEGVNAENYLSRIPSKGLSIISFGNLDGDSFSAQNRQLCNHLLNVKEVPYVKPDFATKPVAITVAELSKYEGKYRWLNQVSWQSTNELRDFSDFYVENNKLKVRYNGNYVVELIPVGKDIFYYQEDFGMQVKFIHSKDNSPTRVTVNFDDGFPGVEMEKEPDQWKPSVSDLKVFTGKYYSRHLDYFWNIELNGQGKIVLQRATMPDAILEPDGLDQFHYIAEKNPGDGFDQWIKFTKNSSGRINGFYVWSDRVMHHRFDKQ